MIRPSEPKLVAVIAFALVVNSWQRSDAQDVAKTQAMKQPHVTLHEDLVFANVDGRQLHLDLMIPKGVQNPPLVVWIHGGGWRNGSKSKSPIRKVANDGFALASIEYRFTDTHVFPAQIHDCKAAVRWLRGNANTYGYDASRIAVGGSSAGGQLALLLGTSANVSELEGSVGDHLDQSSTVQCIIDYFGPSDFVLREKTQPERALTTKSGSFALLGGLRDGKIDAKLRTLASPALHVTKDDPPLLIFHGDKDEVVLMDQSERIRDAYRDAGLPVELVKVSGAGHGGAVFYAETNFAKLAEVLDRHLRRREFER